MADSESRASADYDGEEGSSDDEGLAALVHRVVASAAENFEKEDSKESVSRRSDSETPERRSAAHISRVSERRETSTRRARRISRSRESRSQHQIRHSNRSSLVPDLMSYYDALFPDTPDLHERSALHALLEAVLEVLHHVSPSSEGGKVAMGGVLGWLAGVFLMKIGKMAAFIIGAGLLALQIVHFYGYAEIDWARIHRDISTRGRQFVSHSHLAEEITNPDLEEFINRNMKVTLGFVGGFLIGLAMS